MLLWHKPKSETETENSQNDSTQRGFKYDRISLPALNVNDLFDDAYTSIARDGAANIEVAIRIQKSLKTIKACFKDGGTRIERDFVEAASKLAKQSYERAKLALDYEDDIKRIERVYNDN